MEALRAIPILKTISQDGIEALLAIARAEDIVLARHYINKMSADIERVRNFLKEEI